MTGNPLAELRALIGELVDVVESLTLEAVNGDAQRWSLRELQGRLWALDVDAPPASEDENAGDPARRVRGAPGRSEEDRVTGGLPDATVTEGDQ